MSDTIAVVDADNCFVRWTDRAEVHGKHLPHRSVHVLVFDSEGRLLLQQRRADKLTYPSFWDISVAGHVEREDYPAGPDDDLDAVYQAVAQRELMEELAVDALVHELHREGPRDGVHYEQLRLFQCTWDGPVRIQPEEVQACRWLAADAWEALREEVAVTHALVHWVDWLRARGRFLP